MFKETYHKANIVTMCLFNKQTHNISDQGLRRRGAKQIKKISVK